MKRKFIFFLPFVMMLAASCFKSSSGDVTPLPNIQGTFSGTFYKLRIKTGTTTYDTAAKAQVTLTMSTSTGFAITGDTTLHAGSIGDYQYDYQYIQFSDYNTSNPSTKIHLNGLYGYGYNSSTGQLQIAYSFPQDTLVYFYNLKK